jgi:hypothetical protein
MESKVDVISEQMASVTAILAQLMKRLEGVESSVQKSEMRNSPSPHVSFAFSAHSAESNGEDLSENPQPPSHPRGMGLESPLLNRSRSFNSESSHFVMKDPAIKLVPPSVECKDPLKIRPREFMEYFENVEAFILIWESQPGNTGKKFDGADSFALKNLKVPQQKQLAKLISVIYDRSELRFVKKSEMGNQTFWLSVTTQMAKAKLSVKLANETSLQACVRDLQKIKFSSPYGLIDPDAWDNYKKNILELENFQTSNGFIVPDCVLKDVIISALPDQSFQKDLFLLFGPIGSMYGHQELSDLIATIEARIQAVLGQNLQAVVNRAVANRDAKFTSGKFKANVVQIQEMYFPADVESEEEEQNVSEVEHDDSDELAMQLQAYLTETAGKKSCDRIGVAPDGKLKCKFLGGTKASCIFAHPESDMKLRGKGFTIQAQTPHSSAMRNTASSREL